MKKLMFAAVAAFCATVVANADGITSANVVGYQQKALEGGYNYLINTFAPISGTMKFKDIAVKDIAYLTQMIQLLDDQGACKTTTEYEDLGEVYLQFTYATTADGAATEGWYLMEDYDFAYPQNDREIPFGQGYLIEGQGAGDGLSYSGQVESNDTEVALEAGYNYTGNCTPADIKFKDIAIKDIAYLTQMIQLLDDQGACKTTTEYEDLGEVYLQFTYATTADGATTEGWYLMEDYDFAYPQGERVIEAGQAFLMEGQGVGDSITIPSAL